MAIISFERLITAVEKNLLSRCGHVDEPLRGVQRARDGQSRAISTHALGAPNGSGLAISPAAATAAHAACGQEYDSGRRQRHAHVWDWCTHYRRLG